MLISMFTATRSQVATYLIVVCLFSISLLVFVNATVSFVVTTVVGERKGVGNAVGTLGFADEVVAIFACPLCRLLVPVFFWFELCPGLLGQSLQNGAFNRCTEALNLFLSSQMLIQR